MESTGSDVLRLSNLTAPFGYRVYDFEESRLRPGEVTNFRVALEGDVAGRSDGEVHFLTNVPERHEMTFHVSGVVIALPHLTVSLAGRGRPLDSHDQSKYF